MTKRTRPRTLVQLTEWALGRRLTRLELGRLGKDRPLSDVEAAGVLKQRVTLATKQAHAPLHELVRVRPVISPNWNVLGDDYFDPKKVSAMAEPEVPFLQRAVRRVERWKRANPALDVLRDAPGHVRHKFQLVAAMLGQGAPA